MKHHIITLNYKYCIKSEQYLYQTKLRNYTKTRLSYTGFKVIDTHTINLSIQDMIMDISSNCNLVKIGNSTVNPIILLSFLNRVAKEGLLYIHTVNELDSNLLSFKFDRDIVNYVNCDRGNKLIK